MSNIGNRPYVGTWKLNNRSVVKYTPDALVFINGDTSLPGCARCRGRVEVQKFVTSISVDAGTEPTSHSATIQLTLPRVQGEQVFIDGYNILRAGLEVHIFMRGFFPVRGMFTHLSDPQAGREIQFRNPTDSDQLDLSKYATYPYYPVFHGVVTQVSYDYSDGFYTGSLNCASLLHFWNFINITTAGAWMAQDDRPTNDPGRPTLYGHNFNNVHPFSIIYTLYRDVAGSAAGVDYALDQESNLSAAQTETGRQLFDMVSLYWEQRFKTRIQTLRMYGTNGQLFNAAQQAWLGGADTRDGENLLPSTTYSDPSTTRTEKDPLSSRLSVAKALGLQGSGADFIYSPLIGQDDELFNLSVLDMFAFTQAIEEIGTTELWVSTYQTKMDIAQRVMEVTGYEFFQDVDGDLVFKPPFWNLDTSTNRYYRLEDSDIINITFTEKEPTATYVIVRGVWIEGITGAVGDSPETTKRGLYIDYKLVAKFGWRPAPSLDITYVTDPKVLFWIGVARLDMLNVDTFSASATIPIRPELRPGYPVYIPFADCYYYISQLSHSFAFGGQCTTNLVLTCRRAKWHAPGFLEQAPDGQSAVVKIRLDRPDLPPRPLEIFQNGIPRIVGFPNVVMALDPRQVNPNFSVVGAGIDYFDQFDARTSADLLFGWLQRDVASLDAFEAVGFETRPDGTQVVADPRQIQRFQFRYGDNPQDVIEFSLDDLIQAFTDFKGAVAPLDEARGERNAAQERANQARSGNRTFDPARRAKGVPESTARASALTELDAREGEALDAERKFNQTRGESGSIRLLTMIFDALQPDSNKPIRRKVDGIAGSDVKLSYFETLSHLKSQYIAGSVPGNYRYFSCSHPFTSQQGMPIIEWDDGERGKRQSSGTGRQRGSGGTARRQPASTMSFPPGDSLFTTVRDAIGTLPGIGNWLDTDNLNFEMQKLLGLRPNRRDAAMQLMDERIAQNLMDSMSVANTIVNRILADSDYQQAVRDSDGFVLGNPRLISGFRPSLEPSSAEAFHAQGNAIDITYCDGGNDRAAQLGVTAQHQTAIRVVRTEVVRAMNEGLIKGAGFYILGKGAGGTFVHTDRRPRESREALRQQNQERREAYESGQIDAPQLRGKPGTRRYNRSFRKRKKFFKRIGKRDSVTETQEKSQAPLPSGAGGWTVGSPKPENWRRFARSIGTNFNTGRRMTDPVNKLSLGEGPPTAQEEAPPSDPPPQTTQTTESQGPSIVTRPLSTDSERLVVQFKTTVSKPDEALRAPEAELGVGRVNQGIQIALGPQRTPRVLTTDQIQSISFVRHRAGKFTQLIGPSQTSGRLSFDGQGLQRVLFQKFQEAGQNLDDPELTLSEVYEDLYNQIREDLQSIPIPTYDEGVRGEDTSIEITQFPDVLVVKAEAIPAFAREAVDAKFGELDVYQLADFSIGDLASVPGYVPGGPQDADGQSGTRAAIVAGSNYAARISSEIEAKWNQVSTAALTPAGAVEDGLTKDERLAEISSAFTRASVKAIGLGRVFTMLTENPVQEATPKEGKIDKPIHTPVFPVSDEKGYEHYGAYRYGRGLSVEEGGTFEFIHSGQDPFKNVTAQTAEEFLRVLTLTKQGRTSSSEGIFGQALRGVQEAAAKMEEFVLDQRQEPLREDVASLARDAETTGEAVVGAGDVVEKVGLSEAERNQVEQSVQDLAQVVTELGQTARGQDTLRELLTANGDDPNILKQESFDITDTQFARNFVNFAVNFGKSPVFKTTAANAAYQLSDLTSHLLSRAGEACVCRGAYADVTMAAYARENFVTVDGIDQEEDKATADQSETILQMAAGGIEQEKRVKGQILEGEQPDAKAFEDSQGAGVPAADLGAPLPQGTQVPSQQDAGTVSPENPPTTADPNELPSVTEGPAPLTPEEAAAAGITETPETGPLPSVLDEEDEG